MTDNRCYYRVLIAPKSSRGYNTGSRAMKMIVGRKWAKDKTINSVVVLDAYVENCDPLAKPLLMFINTHNQSAFKLLDWTTCLCVP